jgi:hypothetical protein
MRESVSGTEAPFHSVPKMLRVEYYSNARRIKNIQSCCQYHWIEREYISEEIKALGIVLPQSRLVTTWLPHAGTTVPGRSSH